MIKLNKLTDEQKAELLDEILIALTKENDIQIKSIIVEDLIDLLNDLDTQDFFGTEGWKHRYGFED